MRLVERLMVLIVSVVVLLGVGGGPAHAVDTPATIEGQPPGATVGEAYSFQFTVTGSPTPTVYVPEGSPPLPAGLTLSDSGLLSGTPTEHGQFLFDVGARNSAGFRQQGVQMTVQGPSSISGPQAPYVTAGADFRIDSYQIAGLPAPTASLSDGAPSWLVIDPATAALSGTAPATGGDFGFSIVVDNGVGPSGVLPVTVTVGEAATISGDPPAAVVGEPYSFQFTVSGWPAPVVIVQGGSVMLPPGLHLSRSGLLSGTPTEAGQYMFNLHADNTAGLGQHDTTMTVQAGAGQEEPSPGPAPTPEPTPPTPPAAPSNSHPADQQPAPTSTISETVLAKTGTSINPLGLGAAASILLLGGAALLLGRKLTRHQK